MTERIAFELNGKTRTVEVAPDAPLLYVLRGDWRPHGALTATGEIAGFLA
jgi:hypothetical protein